MYNKHGAALLMVEFGSAGLRVFDVRDGYNPTEVAYFNTSGHVHSGVFHYDAARGIMLQSASSGFRVLELQPQVIAAAGLPTPTDPDYPRYPNGRPASQFCGSLIIKLTRDACTSSSPVTSAT